MVGGRLTLISGFPVMGANSVASASTVYFSPYKGRHIPLWNGTDFSTHDYLAELSQTTTDATKSPTPVTANSSYDVFVWSDGGTYRATRGPAWASNTVRSAQITLRNGIYVNAVSIANGPAAYFGTYIGSIRSNASATIDWIGWGNGTQAGIMGVWNNYNRVASTNYQFDTGPEYTYTAAVARQARGSAQNQISFIIGLPEDSYDVWYQAFVRTVPVTNAYFIIGVGISSTVFAAASEVVTPASVALTLPLSCIWASSAVEGWFTAIALEYGDGIHANNNGIFGGNQLTVRLMM